MRDRAGISASCRRMTLPRSPRPTSRSSQGSTQRRKRCAYQGKRTTPPPSWSLKTSRMERTPGLKATMFGTRPDSHALDARCAASAAAGTQGGAGGRGTRVGVARAWVQGAGGGKHTRWQGLPSEARGASALQQRQPRPAAAAHPPSRRGAWRLGTP